MATHHSKLWHLENVKLFEGFTEEQMMDVDKMTSHIKPVAKDEHIYFPEEPSSSIYFLKQGRVKIGSYSDDGKENIKAVINAGEIFGELAIADEGTRKDFAQAMDNDVMICAMTKEQMEMMMADNAMFSLKLTKLIGFRLRRTERKLNALIFKDSATRISEFVKDLAEDYGKKIANGEILVKHNFTHQEIANLTATSRQTVTTVLNELKTNGIINLERKRILVRDITKL
jgi:CRP-like cAMP-binding protein